MLVSGSFAKDNVMKKNQPEFDLGGRQIPAGNHSARSTTLLDLGQCLFDRAWTKTLSCRIPFTPFQDLTPSPKPNAELTFESHIIDNGYHLQ
jgi:hypothetical protein